MLSRGAVRYRSVFKRPFDTVLGHTIGISGDTERYVCCGGPVLVLDGGAESFERQIR